MNKRQIPILYAILAALCYGVSAPAAKALLRDLPPALMAALLYIGAGLGMLAVNGLRSKRTRLKEARVGKKELPYTLAMIALDIAAPILLMTGLTMTSPATASLLNNFEIVATATIALALFKEAIGRRMWIALALVTVASVILSVEDLGRLSFSPGAFFVLLACVCWGMENNCTRMLSLKDPLQIVVIKGLGSGLGALLVSALMGERAAVAALPIAAALLLGFAAYGLSVYFYILAQRSLGAARTSAFYAFAPFIGVGLSLALFRQAPTASFLIALAVMVLGAYFAAFEKHAHAHVHAGVEHEHRHSHGDGHHTHAHTPPVEGEHSHAHAHDGLTHAHAHTPDMHHAHTH